MLNRSCFDRAWGHSFLCVCVEPRIEVKSVRSCSVLFFRRLLCDVIYLHYLIWLRFEETGKIMEQPTRKTVNPFRLFIQCKAGTFASKKALSSRREEERWLGDNVRKKIRCLVSRTANSRFQAGFKQNFLSLCMALAFAVSWDGLTRFSTTVTCQFLYFRFRGSFGLFIWLALNIFLRMNTVSSE